MNRDEWREVIQFLEPIDVFASLLAISQSIQSLIEECVVTFDAISDCCNGYSETRFIEFQCNDDDHHIRLLGNVRYFINLYLLKLAINLGSLDFSGLCANLILDESHCKLLEFYRLRLLKVQYSREQDPNISYILPYFTLGDARIGKTTLNNCWRNGKFELPFKSIGIEFCIKTCTLPNGVSIKHQIWDTSGRERFYKKEDFLKKHERFKARPMFCFSMKEEESFNGLNEWFDLSRIHIKNKEHSEIILGLFPLNKSQEQVRINCKDAVKKAWTFEKSLFLQVDSENMKNVFAPVWFMQLKYAYFTDLSKLQYRMSEKKAVIPEKPVSGSCILQ